jgi:hypothetical protein
LAELDFKQYGAVQGEYDAQPYFRFADDARGVSISWKFWEIQIAGAS